MSGNGPALGGALAFGSSAAAITTPPEALLRIEDFGEIRVLTINRPERRNALGTKLMSDIADALHTAEHAPEVGAVILTGAPPAFCAGSDLKELAPLSVQGMCEHEAETAKIARRIALLSKPVVAAVEGYALGGGFILAVSCDVVVTASDVRWQMPEVRNGWLPPWGLQALLARVGPVRARQITWGAEAIDGTEAYRLGIADLLTDPGGALPRAKMLAGVLAALPRESVASTKRFFEPFVHEDGERLDAVASRNFAADCGGAAARAALSRFAVKT
jgi:enoyl-CoA hydratase/carnithine racemase